MRLDKYISDAAVCSRSAAAAIIKAGRVSVDGKTVLKADSRLNEKAAAVTLDSKMLRYREFIYIMMNKPAGVISATDDAREKTVLSLLPENYASKGLFPVGRLDKDTVGLLILTNDGAGAHRMLSPKSHVEKTYYVECDGNFETGDIDICKNGIMLDGEMTKPCILRINAEKRNCAEIVLTEGKYHEIKRICKRLGKTVTFLERINFAGLSLDKTLERGQWRDLSDEEIALIKNQ